MEKYDTNDSAFTFSQILIKIKDATEELYKNELNERKDSPKPLTFWFRGVSNSGYKLTPSLYRMDFDEPIDPDSITPSPTCKIPTDKELTVLRAFFAREHFESKRGEQEDYASTYAKMQHYGAPTRLIDWTESVGTALFFATNDNPDTDGRLYITSPERLESEFKERIDEYSFQMFIDTVKNELDINTRARVQSDTPDLNGKSYFDVVRHPKFNNPRILAQRGHFTFTIAPPEVVPESQSITSITISKNEKKKVKHFLAQMNIDEYTIYPDIIGLASYVKSAACLNPRKEFDAVSYFRKPNDGRAEALLLKRANKTVLEELDGEYELFRDTHRSLLSDAIYNKDFVEETIKRNIEDKILEEAVLEAFSNLGKTYLGNIIFPFHLKKRAESFVCEILGKHLHPDSKDILEGPLEYHHSSSLGSFDRFTTGLGNFTNTNGDGSLFKQIITIINPAELIKKSVLKTFKETRFHRHHYVCVPDKVEWEDPLFPAAFASLDGVRKVAILVLRFGKLPKDDKNLIIKYHPAQVVRPRMTYRASNESPDCIIFLTANVQIPKPFSTFGLYLENVEPIIDQLTKPTSDAEEHQPFPAEDLINQVQHNKSEFLRKIGGLLAKTLQIEFGTKIAIDLLNREEVLAEIARKCKITDYEAAKHIDEIEQTVEEVLNHAKASLDKAFLDKA